MQRPAKYRSYDAQTKAQFIAEIIVGGQVKTTARAMGIPRTTAQYWHKEAQPLIKEVHRRMGERMRLERFDFGRFVLPGWPRFRP